MKPNCKTYNGNGTFKYAHIKRDGEFVELIRASDGPHLWSSLPTEVTDKLKWHPDWSKWEQLPVGCTLLGECYLPGGTSSDVKTARIEQNPNLLVEWFAIGRWPTLLQPHVERMSLESTMEYIEDFDLPFILFQPLQAKEDLKELLQSCRQVISDDIEGFVLKNGNLLDWTKYKPRTTIDLVITGYEDGAGKYAGLLGSIIVATAEGYEVARVSGMTDEQRRWISERSAEYLGAVCEVEYQSIGSQGRLRHPSFVRIRDDKAATACVVTQDEILAKHWQRLF